MSKSFEARLSRIAADAAQSQTPSPRRASAPAQGRKAKLPRALSLLDRAGIRGNYAYAPAFRALARLGLIVKPLHFWSPLPLVLFGFAVISACMGLGIGLSLVMFDHPPRVVQRIIESGPLAFFAVNAVLGVGFALLHWWQARQAALPRWAEI